MNLTELIRKLKRYDQNAAVIFDDEEPIGRPTDLVLPRRHWFRRRERRQTMAPARSESKIA